MPTYLFPLNLIFTEWEENSFWWKAEHGLTWIVDISITQSVQNETPGRKGNLEQQDERTDGVTICLAEYVWIDGYRPVSTRNVGVHTYVHLS